MISAHDHLAYCPVVNEHLKMDIYIIFSEDEEIESQLWEWSELPLPFSKSVIYYELENFLGFMKLNPV